MNEETKEIIRALIEGFYGVINNMKSDLKNKLKTELMLEIRKIMTDNTNRIIRNIKVI